MNKIKYFLFLVCCVVYSISGQAQTYSILIKGGHVIDPKNNLDKKMDVALIDGVIAKVADNIDSKKAELVIDAKGLYITPGLIDMHAHHFFGTLPDSYLRNSFEALPPDGFTFRCGVTTVVDAGSPGWKTFQTFKEQTIKHSKTRVFTFINIVGEGMCGGPYEQNPDDMNAKMTAMVIQQNPEAIGVKVAHYSDADWTPIDRAVEAGKLADVPVMIDFGQHEPPLSLEELLLEKLRAGDIFTHAYAHVAGRMSIVDDNGKVASYVWEAKEKGIIFDVGHGGGSFSYAQAWPAVQAGFFPQTISTDLHIGSMNSGMKDMNNVMSKMLNLGMSLSDVIAASTWTPACVIQKKEYGHLSEGAVADIAILNVREGDFGFTDAAGLRMNGNKKLECELTILGGEIVYDLNGISKPLWKSE